MNNHRIKELHMVLDSADPYLMEFIYDKTKQELNDYLLQLDKELASVHPNNVDRKEWYKQTMTVVNSLIELRVIEEDDDNFGGHIVT